MSKNKLGAELRSSPDRTPESGSRRHNFAQATLNSPWKGFFNNLLVNDGGRDATGKHVMDMANDDWDMMIRTNLHGAFWCCRSFGGLSMNLGQGRVSN